MQKIPSTNSRRAPEVKWVIAAVAAISLLGIAFYPAFSLGYTESKGPFKNWAQPVDLNGDGKLDVLISHTRWEETAISWAGVGRWINQGGGAFALQPAAGSNDFNGFAGAAGDVDLDGDADIFVQEFGTRLLVNQGGLQGGQAGAFAVSGGFNAPPAFSNGYRDMGGTITLGDFNGDGWPDAFTAGCCYGSFSPTSDAPGSPAYAPSVSWVWINDRARKGVEDGHITALNFLDGAPIRQAAVGDLDGDGDLDIFAAVGTPTLGTASAAGNLLLLNDGSGAFTLASQPVGAAGSTSAALGDANGDGRLDVLIGAGGGAQLWINQGNKNGEPVFKAMQQTFETAQTFSEGLRAGLWAAAGRLSGLYLPYGSTRTTTVQLADLDGDGDLDALIGRLWGAEIWWNAGAGAFERSAARLPYAEDTGLTAADLDGDGDLDIFTAGNGGRCRIWWNDGRGTFTAGQS